MGYSRYDLPDCSCGSALRPRSGQCTRLEHPIGRARFSCDNHFSGAIGPAPGDDAHVRKHSTSDFYEH